MKEYQIFAARENDIAAPFIWATNPGVPSRSVAKVKNTTNGKSVYCEVLVMDVNFRGNYNGSENTKNITEGIEAAVISSWYRQCLDIEKNQKATLDISVPFYVPSIVRQINAGLSHPDSAVRLASDLAVVSVVLGLIGLALGAISLFK